MTHNSDVTSIAFSPDGRWIASGSADGTARVWDTASGVEVARMTHQGIVYSIAFSLNGEWVISGSADSTARAWLWMTDELIQHTCIRLTRNLNQAEWKQYIGGDYHSTCPNLPPGAILR